MHEKMNIHDKLRYIRFLKKINKKQFAELLEVSQPTVARYESEEREPDYNFIKGLVSELNVNPNWIFLDEEPVFLKIQRKL